MSKRIVNNKEALLKRKEELLNDIKYYDKRIEEAKKKLSAAKFVSYDDDSSDSEIELMLDPGPSVTELRLQESKLRTCLRATQELTDMDVLEHQIDILVDPPTYEGESLITEEGMWRSVQAECRVDLVPFTISFYTHQSSRAHAPPRYRGLHVQLAKPVQAQELARSALSAARTPSDAVEVLCSYARAHRVRRSVLARLADKYSDDLFMEALPEGGYSLRCAELLRASWTLDNKCTPLSDFRHKMSFDVDYMDESYVKIIRQANKQLSDPTIDKDERTLLLASIIDTCLEAHRQAAPSDLDSSDNPAKEVMGPPKTLPKKTKPKGKENRKRSRENSGEGSAKKTKTNENNKDDASDIGDAEISKNSVNNSKTNGKNRNVDTAKDNVGRIPSTKNNDENLSKGMTSKKVQSKKKTEQIEKDITTQNEKRNFLVADATDTRTSADSDQTKANKSKASVQTNYDTLEQKEVDPPSTAGKIVQEENVNKKNANKIQKKIDNEKKINENKNTAKVTQSSENKTKTSAPKGTQNTIENASKVQPLTKNHSSKQFQSKNKQDKSNMNNKNAINKKNIENSNRNQPSCSKQSTESKLPKNLNNKLKLDEAKMMNQDKVANKDAKKSKIPLKTTTHRKH